MSLSWASHWNTQGWSWIGPRRVASQHPRSRPITPLGHWWSTVILWCFCRLFSERCFFSKENTTYVPGAFSTLQVVPPILRGADDKIANRCPLCHIQEVHPKIFNWTRIWQSNPEKGKIKVSTCKSLEDLPIESWSLEALEVSIWSCITGFPKWGWVKTLVPSEPQNSW